MKNPPSSPGHYWCLVCDPKSGLTQKVVVDVFLKSGDSFYSAQVIGLFDKAFVCYVNNFDVFKEWGPKVSAWNENECILPLTADQAEAISEWIGAHGKNSSSPAAICWRNERENQWTNMSFGSWIGEVFSLTYSPWERVKTFVYRGGQHGIGKTEIIK